MINWWGKKYKIMCYHTRSSFYLVAKPGVYDVLEEAAIRLYTLDQQVERHVENFS